LPISLKNESTDVLSFGQQDDEEQFLASEGLTLLGDIVISLDDMQANCEIFNVSFDEELKRLIVHGILHLVGEDHTSNNDDEPMLKRQEEIMKFLLKGSD
jgi:probable rRNA maturation factor